MIALPMSNKMARIQISMSPIYKNYANIKSWIKVWYLVKYKI